MTAETLHAPTLRRVIEMLDGEIAEAASRSARSQFTAVAQAWRDRSVALRAFRERLERRELANAPAVGGASYE